MNSDRKLYMKPGTWVIFSGLVLAILLFLLFTTAMRMPEPVTTIEIITKPPNATVYWNGAEKGASPITIQSKGRLSGSLVIRMPGYKSIDRQLALESGKSQRIRYDLEFETMLKVESDPIGAKIYVDGKFWGSTPMTFDGLVSPGNHEVRIDDTEYCFGEVTKKVVLVEKQRLDIKEVLPKLSLVTITTNPKGATVSANGKEWGVTPLSKCVPLGKYKIKFEKKGLVAEEREIEIKEDFSFTVRMYDPGSYKLKDSYTVTVNQKDAKITMIAMAAGNPPQVVGKPVLFDKDNVSVAKEDMFKMAGIDQQPFAYIIMATKEGFAPAIVQANEPGEYNLVMQGISGLSTQLQAKYNQYSSLDSPYPKPMSSPDGKFTVTVNDKNAILSDGSTNKELYLPTETEPGNNSFAWNPDSTEVYYFRNNKGARELVSVNFADFKETVLDTINPKDFFWTKTFPPDILFQNMTALCYDSGILYYLVPGGSQKQMSLASKKASGGERRVISRDLLPLADLYTLWMDRPDVLKIGGVFPGSKYAEGLFDLAAKQPINIKLTTPDKMKVGNYKILESDFVMYEAMHAVDFTEGNLMVAIRLYPKLDGLFLFEKASGYFELLGVVAK